MEENVGFCKIWHIASFKKTGYFQLHGTSLLDALHMGDMIPPSAFCNFSLSSHRICQIIHP